MDVVGDFAGDGGSYYTVGLFVRFLIEGPGAAACPWPLWAPDRARWVREQQQVVSEATRRDLDNGAWALLLNGVNQRAAKGDPFGRRI